jgi:hypothetical protein
MGKDGKLYDIQQFDEFRVWPKSKQTAKKTPGPITPSHGVPKD